jgi:transposase
MIWETASREELLRGIATQQEQIAALTARVRELEARLATDSHNSSKPPASDGPGAKPHPQSLRTPSGRKPGGQPGHLGYALHLAEVPDVVVVHTPVRCPVCGRSLAGCPAIRRERRQVVDLPSVRPQVVEHQAETKACPACGAEATGEFPAGVEAPAQYGPGVAAVAVYLNQAQLLPLERTGAVLAELFGCPLAEGTVERAVGACHARLVEVEATIKQAVTRASVTHFDETGLDLGGQTAWLHVASTAHLTFYAAHRRRGRVALDAIGVLPCFAGRAVHDGWAAYWQYGQCQHALCNAHHLRELTFVEEQLGQPWARDLKDLLLEIKHAVDTARAHGSVALAAADQREFARRFDAVLDVGLQANPPPAPTGQRGRPKRGKAGSLVARLQSHKAATLAFMEDFAIPFDNNQAERDIRMTKVRQKISGCFRTPTGADRFCRIRGYISTLRKQGMPVFSALRQTLAGAPPTPAIV